MESNTSFKRASFIASIVGIIFFSILIMTLGSRPSEGAYIAFPSKSQYVPLFSLVSNKSISLVKPAKLGLPVSLTIPKLKVDAPVKYVGLTSGGLMDVPPGPYDVARFKLGPRPGQKGSAVVAGHVGIWKNGAISVFNKLHTLRNGDTISIKDDIGKTITFVVRESKTYASNADASKVFTSTDGKSHLNLVTCVWDKVSKKYSKRLVVFTDKI